MSEERRQKQTLRIVQEQLSKSSENKWVKTTGGVVAVLIAASVALYVARPEVSIVGVFIECAICDDPTQIHPPRSSHDDAATINVRVQNTGQTGTTILSNNTTMYSTDDTSFNSSSLSEVPNPRDNIPFNLGSHADIVLSHAVNEAFIYFKRHPDPNENEKTFMYGHITYLGPFWIPVTAAFCLEYRPPVRGLQEHWDVCSK